MSAISCEQLSQRLVDFVEGELPAEQSSAFKDHLEQCELCQELVTSYLKTIFILKQLNKIEPPPDLVNRLREYLKTRLTV